jgi:hypothetical protein
LAGEGITSADAEEITRPRSASTLLGRLGELIEGERISVGAMSDALGRSGLGITILMLALPSFIPIPGLPTGFVFGTALAILSLQVLSGAESLILPGWIRRFSMPRDPVVRGAAYIAPWFRKVEWMLRPRLSGLSGRRAQLILALPIFIHSVMILLPIPLGNQLPALAVIAFAFGFIERDGIAILAGAVISVLALAWNGAIIFFGAELSIFLWGWGAGMIERLGFGAA